MLSYILPLLVVVPAALAAAVDKRALPLGLDVSGYQPGIDWASVKANGASFAYIKATEGTSKYSRPRPRPNESYAHRIPRFVWLVAYTSGEFSAQYLGAYNQGISALHFLYLQKERSSEF